MTKTVMVVDNTAASNRENARQAYALLAKETGFQMSYVSAGQAMNHFVKEVVDVALVLWDAESHLVRQLRERAPLLAILAVSRQCDPTLAPCAVENGAFDLVPLNVCDVTNLQKKIQWAMICSGQQRLLDKLKQIVIGDSPQMDSLLNKEVIPAIRHPEQNLLIQGETGTGKDWFAEVIHYLRERLGGPFNDYHACTLVSSLMEAQLYGRRKGGFTGATDAVGMFEASARGTVFLNEIGLASPELQARLLQVLEKKEVFPVGDVRQSIPIEARIICATNRDLLKDVVAGRFREDLYYRIAQRVITLPPLRERGDDVRRLVRHWAPKVTEPAMNEFARRSYPGNVRQLRDAVQSARSNCEDRGSDEIDVVDLELPRVQPSVQPPTQTDDYAFPTDVLHQQLESAEKEVMKAFYRVYLPYHYNEAAGIVAQACRCLGIGDDKTFWKKWDEAGIPRPPRHPKRS